MITIKNYISMIYDDLREYIDQNVNLCMLKTLNYQAGNIKSLPLCFDRMNDVNSLAENNVELSKQDWDSFETSWDFESHPLI